MVVGAKPLCLAPYVASESKQVLCFSFCAISSYLGLSTGLLVSKVSSASTRAKAPPSSDPLHKAFPSSDPLHNFHGPECASSNNAHKS